MSTTIKPSYQQPALVGGVVMGVLSALPFVSAGNLCCCLWVVSGGVVAAYLFQQNQAAPITPADGALVGLLAGLVGAVVQILIKIPIDILVGPMELAMVQRVLDGGTFPPEVRDMMERYGRGGGAVGGAYFIVTSIVGLMFWVFVGGIFSTLGGLVGSLIFKKQTPSGIIDIPPQA